MSIRSALLVATAAMAFAASPAAAAAEPKTAAAVRAADDAWGKAEELGDADFVDGLLMPGYVSIGSTGKTTTKQTIVDHARSRGRSAERSAQIAAWKAAHPSRADVALFGDTAVLKWVDARPDAGDLVRSSDIFVYRDGRWRAIYSQHTAAAD